MIEVTVVFETEVDREDSFWEDRVNNMLDSEYLDGVVLEVEQEEV